MMLHHWFHGGWEKAVLVSRVLIGAVFCFAGGHMKMSCFPVREKSIYI